MILDIEFDIFFDFYNFVFKKVHLIAVNDKRVIIMSKDIDIGMLSF